MMARSCGYVGQNAHSCKRMLDFVKSSALPENDPNSFKVSVQRVIDAFVGQIQSNNSYIKGAGINFGSCTKVCPVMDTVRAQRGSILVHALNRLLHMQQTIFLCSCLQGFINQGHMGVVRSWEYGSGLQEKVTDSRNESRHSNGSIKLSPGVRVKMSLRTHRFLGSAVFSIRNFGSACFVWS